MGPLDEETENRLKGLMGRIINPYDGMGERLAALDRDVCAIRKDMGEAAISLRDKQAWRLDEMDKEIKAFAAKMG